MATNEFGKALRVFEISSTATEEEMRKRYKALAKKWHPDVSKSKESEKMMQEINHAYEIIMKQGFGVLDVWEDYGQWWMRQYGNDPLWGNPTAEEYYGKSRKYPGFRKSRQHIENSSKISEKSIEFLDKKNIFAVIGASRDPKKYGNKVYFDLKGAGYKVYAVNPHVENIRGDKCYPSLNALPELPDVVNIVVPPKITEDLVKEASKLGVKKVWMQPGSESKEAISFCKSNKIQVLHDVCVIVERRR